MATKIKRFEMRLAPEVAEKLQELAETQERTMTAVVTDLVLKKHEHLEDRISDPS